MQCVSYAHCKLCILGLHEVHRMWLVGHKMLHTLLHKAARSIFSEPRMRPVVVGSVPYRGFTHSMYQDGMVTAEVIVVATAFGFYFIFVTGEIATASVLYSSTSDRDRFRLFLHYQLQHVHPTFNKNQQRPNNKSCGGPVGASSGAGTAVTVYKLAKPTSKFATVLQQVCYLITDTLWCRTEILL